MTPPIEVSIPSGGQRLAGGVYAPPGEGPHAAVVLGMGFGATRAGGLGRYAERFREAGVLAVAFDYRHFGASEGEPRQLLSVSRQMEDWHAAIRFARTLPTVDPDRVALWGTSFSGGHVLRAAAEDDRIAAVVSQIPFTDGLATTLKLPLLSAMKAAGLAVADVARVAIGGAPVTIPLVGRPGEAAAMALDEAVAGFRDMYAGQEWTNRVCARIGLVVPFYRPGRNAPRVTCPLLVQVGERDSLTPPGPARRAAERAPRGTVSSYPLGHFDFYFGRGFEETTAEQVAFLREHLLDVPSAGAAS